MTTKAPIILIVEDELDLQQAYTMILKSRGYSVETASNGIEGLEKIKAFSPALMLLDIFMPRMDGRELLRNLDLDLYPDMKVIVYSNLSDKGIEEEMISLGAHQVILKSKTGPSDLLELVRRSLSGE